MNKKIPIMKKYKLINFLSSFLHKIADSNGFYETAESPNLIEPDSIGQTLVFLNDTGLVVPCRASGTPTPLTTWILASKLFDATELFSTSDLINNLNNQESHHEYHHRNHAHRSTGHRLLNDELFIDLNNLKTNFKEFKLINQTSNTERLKRSIKSLNFQNLNEPPSSDWLNENLKLKELPGLRYIRSDGALVFPPFASSFYSPSVHHTGYICIAWNQAGTILSSQINIKAGMIFGFKKLSCFFLILSILIF